MAHGTYDNPRAGSNSSKGRMQDLANKVNGDGEEKFYSASVGKAKKKGIHKVGKFKKSFKPGDVMFQEKRKSLSTDRNSGDFYVTKSKTHYTKPPSGVKTPFTEVTVKEKTKRVSEKKASKINTQMHKKNLKKHGKDLKQKK
tara:strand:+ start:156 stop:581 length:426 start_codon:yes stop_codon:yes gene_type:complete